MTKELAIEKLKVWLSEGMDGLSDERLGYLEGWFDKDDAEAFKMAIKALELLTSDDVISRQAVLDKTVRVNSIWKSITNSEGKNLEEILSELPPVNPQESMYCDRNICINNEYNGIGCDGCEVTKSQELCNDTIGRILKRMWNCRGKHTTSIDKIKMEQIIRDELSINLQEHSRDMEEIAEIMKCGVDAETKCKMISNILTAKPHYFEEPKTGYWIEKDDKTAVCSCCNRYNALFGDYCKWCGARMVEPQESEIHCNCTDAEIAKSFIEDVEATKNLLP